MKGAYFNETSRSEAITTIYLLVPGEKTSRWYRLTSDEVLHFYDGSPLQVTQYTETDGRTKCMLGRDLSQKQHFHLTIKSGTWHNMRSIGEWSLIGCTVAPAFQYPCVELAPPRWEPPLPDWTPGPNHSGTIQKAN